MTILSKLNLSDKTKAAMFASPEARGRRKNLEANDNQIAAAKADANDETVELRGMRWVKTDALPTRVFAFRTAGLAISAPIYLSPRPGDRFENGAL